jgi:hypothetical protein
VLLAVRLDATARDVTQFLSLHIDDAETGHT